MSAAESIDLDAIEARLAAATPGPWDTDGTTVWACVIVPDPRDQSGQTPMQDRELVAQSGDPDADLIAHAPTDLAALVAEVRRLSRRLGMTRDNAADDLAELRAENERLRDDYMTRSRTAGEYLQETNRLRAGIEALRDEWRRREQAEGLAAAHASLGSEERLVRVTNVHTSRAHADALDALLRGA